MTTSAEVTTPMFKEGRGVECVGYQSLLFLFPQEEKSFPTALYKVFTHVSLAISVSEGFSKEQGG